MEIITREQDVLNIPGWEVYVTKVSENSIQGRLITADARGDLKKNKDCEECYQPSNLTLDGGVFEYLGDYTIKRFNSETWSLDTLDKYGNILHSRPSKINYIGTTFKEYINKVEK